MVDTKSDEANMENGPQKTAKQLQKEAKKLAKLEKFKQKQEKKETEKPVNVKEKSEVRFIFIFSISNILSVKILGVLIIHMDHNYYPCN